MTTTVTHTVTDDDTAVAMGSGDVHVLGTPRLLAWFEAATVMEAAHLIAADHTSVGSRVDFEHSRPTPVGQTIEVSATLAEASSGRRLEFEVQATDSRDRIIGTGRVVRVVVEQQRFIASANAD